MNPNIINIKNLNLKFGGKPVLNNITLEFERGKTVLIAGNNGAGKSTLLKCIAGVLFPDSGSIHMADGVTAKQVGFISDKMSLFQDYTLKEGIQFHKRMFGIADGDMDLSLLDKLTPQMDRKIKTLSNGERAVYHLTLLMAQKPELLLIDEIIHVIDPYLRDLFLEGVIELMDAYQTTVIMINHTFSEMGRLPERVIIMEEGGVVFDEITADLNLKIKKMVTQKPYDGDMPVIFENRTPLYNEYYIYPFNHQYAAAGHAFVDVELAEIVKSFIGGYYAKKRN